MQGILFKSNIKKSSRVCCDKSEHYV